MANIVNANYCTSEQEHSANDSLYQVIEDVFKIYIPLVLAFCGIISNLINMFIFCKLGLKDSISINLLALSFVDFLTTVFVDMVCMCFLTNKLYPANSDASNLGYYGFGYTMNAMYLTSCWVTALITVERCFCVVFPFTFKLIFTKRRSIIIIATIGLLHLALHIPLNFLQRTECYEIFQEVPGSGNPNVSARMFATLSNERAARLHMIFNITVTAIFGNVAFIIVIISTVWMIYALLVTARIRQEMSLNPPEVTRKKSHLSIKEKKLTKVALALAITLSSCAIPRIFVVAVNNSISPMLQYIEVMWAFAYICTTFGCSITIVVYMSLNNNYRVAFIRTFGNICRCLGSRK